MFEKPASDPAPPLSPPARPQPPQRLFLVQTPAIGPVADHGVPRVGDRRDPRPQRYVVSDEMIGIPRAVDTLMVVPDHRQVIGNAAQRETDPLAFDRVRFHYREFLVR